MNNEEKLEIFRNWLDLGEIFVQIDPRRPGVAVPENLQSSHSLTLRMSLAFNYIPTADPEKIECTLKFGNSYFDCVLPWDSVWAMSVDTGNPKTSDQRLWHQDMPREAAAEFARELLRNTGTKFKQKLGLSKKPPPEKVKKEPVQGKEKSSQRKVPHLKRIK